MSIDEMHGTVRTSQQAWGPVDNRVRGKFDLLLLFQTLQQVAVAEQR